MASRRPTTAMRAARARVERQEGNRRAPGGRGGRRERGPAQKAPPKTGTVTEFTTNPDGETDGLRLDDGTQVRFRPDAGEKVTRGVSLKDRITIEGWTHSGEAEMHVATIKNETSGKTLVVDRPPPEIADGGENQAEASGDQRRRGVPKRALRDPTTAPSGTIAANGSAAWW